MKYKMSCATLHKWYIFTYHNFNNECSLSPYNLSLTHYIVVHFVQEIILIYNGLFHLLCTFCPLIFMWPRATISNVSCDFFHSWDFHRFVDSVMVLLAIHFKSCQKNSDNISTCLNFFMYAVFSNCSLIELLFSCRVLLQIGFSSIPSLRFSLCSVI